MFDETIGGTVLIAVGRSHPPEPRARTSAVHWDMACDLRVGGSLTADGVVIQHHGRFI